MLYNNFIICIMSCALFAMINMIHDQHWRYIILPIGILIWGSYKFFRDNQRSYLKQMGKDPDREDSILSDFFFGSDYDSYDSYGSYGGYNSHNTPRRHGNTITWDNGSRRVEDNFDYELYRHKGTSDYTRYQPRNWQDPRYKGMVEKCKRNFKITVEEHKNEEKSKTALFFSKHNND